MKSKVLSCVVFLFIVFLQLESSEFTVCSYNAGGLSDHYDYIRSAAMQKLLKERYEAEPELMDLIEKIQRVSLKIIFSEDPNEQQNAQKLWEEEGLQGAMEQLIAPPIDQESPNYVWYNKSLNMLTSYLIRPIVIYDEEIKQMLIDNAIKLTSAEGVEIDPNDFEKLITEGRTILTNKIFQGELKHDIICLQEASYLDESFFPNYEVRFSDEHSINGIAWNKNRFECLEVIEDMNKGLAVLLKDNETDHTVLVVSGHITGCNPFVVVEDPKTGVNDSEKGDKELGSIVEALEAIEADIKIIGMDSNVAPTHPRLNILKNSGYRLDSDSALEMTCANPYLIWNTRLDWIAIKTDSKLSAKIVEESVPNVKLNSIETNISDHKPIAARISY